MMERPPKDFESPQAFYHCAEPHCAKERVSPADCLYWVEDSGEVEDGFYCNECFEECIADGKVKRGISLLKWLKETGGNQ